MTTGGQPASTSPDSDALEYHSRSLVLILKCPPVGYLSTWHTVCTEMLERRVCQYVLPFIYAVSSAGICHEP